MDKIHKRLYEEMKKEAYKNEDFAKAFDNVLKELQSMELFSFLQACELNHFQLMIVIELLIREEKSTADRIYEQIAFVFKDKYTC